jgi:SsrA-binding protein
MSAPKTPDNQLANNRLAYHNYEIIEKIEAGIVLTGPEVKSVRARQINLKPAYISIESGQAILKNCHISAYKPANDLKYQPERYRKLLLHKNQLLYLDKKLSEKGLTLVPLSAYLIKGKIKLQIGLGKGKQAHDKRHDLKKKSQSREIERHFRK